LLETNYRFVSYLGETMNHIFRMAIFVLIFAIPSFCLAQEFYKGKTVTFVLGSSPGGGFDVYTRTIGRHIGKHIPGNPSVIVDYIQGAGGLIAANQLYNNKSMQEGLTVGLFAGSLILNQRLGEKGAQFDPGGFNWMGVPVRDSPVCVLTKKSGITNVEDWYGAKRPIKLGGIGPGSTPSVPPRVLKASIGLPIQLIDGYKGTSDIRIAAESGELDGGCWNWESVKVTWRQGLESGEVQMIIQINPQRHPELPNIPNAIEFAKTETARQLIKVGVHDQSSIFRAYSIPPKVPKDRVRILQTAFRETMSDPDFLNDAKQAKLDLFPMSGDQIKQIVDGMIAVDPKTLTELKKILLD
jgi:tripartite-type tricarboxylate transporter receptor subunit TctC